MKTRLVLSALVLVLLSTALVHAGKLQDQEYESRILSDRWGLSLGGAAVDFKTQVAIGSGSILGTILRLEEILGLQEDLSRGRLGGFYRFNRKHAFEAIITQLNRDAISAVDEEFTILDPPLTFGFGAVVQSQFDNTIFQTQYRYSFINNGKTEAGFVAGLNAFDFDLELSGLAIFTDSMGMTEERQAEGQESILIPVPSLGMYINHAFTPKWILRMRATFLDLSVDDYEGGYLDTAVTVDWIFTRHFGLGAGFTRSDLDFEKSGDDPFQVEYKLSGLVYYGTVVF